MKKIIIICAAITLIACKSAENASATTSTNESEVTNPQDQVFDVIVQFISKGEGIAHPLKTKFEEAVANFNKTNHTNIEADVRYWGREGEVDLNYNLKNLSTGQKKAFLGMVKEAVGDTDMIHLKFNEKGVQKR